MINEMKKRVQELGQEIQNINSQINQLSKRSLMLAGGLIELEAYLKLIGENGNKPKE